MKKRFKYEKETMNPFMDDADVFMDPNFATYENDSNTIDDAVDELIDPNFAAYENDSTFEEINNIPYFVKQQLHKSDRSTRLWNTLYSHLQLPVAFTFQGHDYYPKMGDDVPINECKKACQVAQETLIRHGYFHTDLFEINDENELYYNCTNVRKVGNNYYAIDMDKIIPLREEPVSKKRKKGGNRCISSKKVKTQKKSKRKKSLRKRQPPKCQYTR